MSTDYGTDVSTYPDLDATFAILSGPRVVAENVARRLEALLRGALNADFTAIAKSAVTAAIQAEAAEDERVLDATAVVSHLDETLTASVSLTLIEGETFSLVLSVSAVTVEALFGDT